MSDNRHIQATRVHPERIRPLNNRPVTPGPVVYWMHRDQRSADNWALLHAADLALGKNAPLLVVFCLGNVRERTDRHLSLMMTGLAQLETALQGLRIPLVVINGAAETELPSLLNSVRAGALVTDFSPLREHRLALRRLLRVTAIAAHEVDAHNIVPCWAASQKEEVGARTLRPKIQRMLRDFLNEIPAMSPHPFPWMGVLPENDWQRIRSRMTGILAIPEIDTVFAGESEAANALNRFIRERLNGYHDRRNDPAQEGQSGLSPYFHFGQLSPQRAALAVEKADVSPESKKAFLEELVVRRELSDNFCLYNPRYDSVEGFPAWARKSLDEHRRDKREFRYSPSRLEQGQTHDPLWNAAQMELVHRGKMHGYMRMYWAKKILEWSPSPEAAMKEAIRLNDTYSLDGNDPNGYAGIAWSIGGVHDRPWFDRPVIGKIRWMTYNGCMSKFDVGAYIESVRSEVL